MEQHQEELATIESIDSGAVYTLALKTHVGMSIQTFRYFAGWCDKIQVCWPSPLGLLVGTERVFGDSASTAARDHSTTPLVPSRHPHQRVLFVAGQDHPHQPGPAQPQPDLHQEGTFGVKTTKKMSIYCV